MLEKDASYSKLRSEKMLERHPSLVDSFRTILFDWLSEVSFECHFHRETYHLALDFVDRYLSCQSNVGKLQLQLIGTTCLFLAAKFEEIRPPSVNEFADLTDGACKPEDIIENEVIILSALNWEITPMTPNNWLDVYMQIMLNLDKDNEEESEKQAPGVNDRPKTSQHRNSAPLVVVDENSESCDSKLMDNDDSQQKLSASRNDSFILPANNGIFRSNHKRIASVIDLALLHIESLRFSNSVLTASALYYFTDEQTVRQCTGFQYRDLASCIKWLKPFAETIKEIQGLPVFVATCKSGNNQSPQMHSHIATAGLLDRVQYKMAEAVSLGSKPEQTLKRKLCTVIEDENADSDYGSLLSPSKPTTLLTPPRSVRKSRRIR